jgi:Pyruvate/2-oxoacid:ferredoxin oxidoreductase delta subunit
MITPGEAAKENTQWLPLVDYQHCTNCGICLNVCPTHALGRIEDKIGTVRPDACNYCGQCEAQCPENAIVLPYQIVQEIPS